MARQLKVFHGNITSENIFRYITPIVQTGNLHVAVYDLSAQVCHFVARGGSSMRLHATMPPLRGPQVADVSFARKDGSPGPQMGYDRQYSFLNMTALFSEPAPTPTGTSKVVTQ